ncbi:DUF3467 domain-containing protein [Paenibacillus sp. sptzw28]|uniref:DUF3467 domain-containing protein n=1 Tax=Paenibacillus sp. sptzw28 TaxID=715179 RepID=UPI001C6DF66F|nr:DUF3467 domain-containing protein [Paenibacillus sp. sptzw28]QYR20787.1 DUF3467 domain-containing protein [Paenibacillus sp. sptzw28]
MSESNQKFRTYSNELGITVSLYDFIFEIKENNPNGEKITHGTITVSPQHAKSFLQVLAENIAKYEEMFGSIKIPDYREIEELQRKGLLQEKGE